MASNTDVLEVIWVQSAAMEKAREWRRHAMSITFEWDDIKAKRNMAKHGVSFEEAALVFADPLSLTIPDPLHSKAEERYITLGQSRDEFLVVVVHTDHRNHIRIISARRASKQERSAYEEGRI